MKAALVLLLPPGELSRKLEGVKARAPALRKGAPDGPLVP
jgi:hypothetical protein